MRSFNFRKSISSLCAAALMLTSTLGELPLAGIGSTAYAEATVDMEYIHTARPIEMVVKTDNSGVLTAETTLFSYSESDFTNFTTIGELKELYTGFTVGGLEFSTISETSISVEDIDYRITVQSGTPEDLWSGWDSVTNVDLMSFADDISAPDTNIVSAISVGLMIESSVLEAAGVKEGTVLHIDNAAAQEAVYAEYAYDGSPITITMGASGESAYWGYGLYQLSIDGLTEGSTTFAQLKELFDGIKMTDWEFKGTSLEYFDRSCLTFGILVTAGPDYSWHTINATNVLLSDYTDIADDDVIHSVSLQLMYWDSGAHNDFSVNNEFVVNPEAADEWDADFTFDATTGMLSWNAYENAAYPELLYEIIVEKTDKSCSKACAFEFNR